MKHGIIGILSSAIVLGSISGCNFSPESTTPLVPSESLTGGLESEMTPLTSNVTEEIKVEIPPTLSPLADGSYVINMDTSKIFWEAAKAIGGGHEGSIKISRGNLMIENNTLSGDFTVDTTSIIATDTPSEGLLKHIKSADFLDVENHPTATFSLLSNNQTDATTYRITGNLTIKNITQEIQFNTVFTSTASGNLIASADIPLDRSQWDIRYGSPSFFADIGDKAINDLVKIRLDLEFIQQ